MYFAIAYLLLAYLFLFCYSIIINLFLMDTDFFTRNDCSVKKSAGELFTQSTVVAWQQQIAAREAIEGHGRGIGD